jgi:hypothetical protein
VRYVGIVVVYVLVSGWLPFLAVVLSTRGASMGRDGAGAGILAMVAGGTAFMLVVTCFLVHIFYAVITHGSPAQEDDLPIQRPSYRYLLASAVLPTAWTAFAFLRPASSWNAVVDASVFVLLCALPIGATLVHWMARFAVMAIRS